MSLTAQLCQPQPSFKIKDISLATQGCEECALARVEMPGLMEIQRRYQDDRPLDGVCITGSLHMTTQTAILMETLLKLGARLRWCSCNIYSTQDTAAAAIMKEHSESASVFAWKNETLEEYWWCTYQALCWPEGSSCQLLVDDGGDTTMLIHKGIEFERVYQADHTLPPLDASLHDEVRCMHEIIRYTIQHRSPQFWTDLSKHIVGVSEETTTGVHRLLHMHQNGVLAFPAINVNDSITKSKFDNIYGCRHSLPDGLMRATDVMLAGKKVIVCGYGDVGKGSAQAMRACGARTYITEVDPICALQACMEGFHVVTLEQEIADADIVITATGNVDIVTFEHMQQMKHNAIVGNVGHFDNEIQMEALLDPSNGIRRVEIKPQCDRFEFPDGHSIIVLALGRLLNLGCATGHPSFVMSCSFTNQVLAQIELWKNRTTQTYPIGVHLLPKVLDEMVAGLHLPSLGATLTVLSDKQAKYMHTNPEGPFKPDTYHY